MFSLHAIKWKLYLSNFNVSFFELRAKMQKNVVHNIFSIYFTRNLDMLKIIINHIFYSSFIYIFDTKHKCIIIIDVSLTSTKKYSHMSHVFAYFMQIFNFQIWMNNWNLIVHQSQGTTSCIVDVQSRLDMSTNNCHDVSWHLSQWQCVHMAWPYTSGSYVIYMGG
jgi:hypothetical protein